MSTKLPVSQFTSANLVTGTADQSIDELRQLMREHGVRHLPIMRGGDLVGVVSDRDLRVALGLSAEHQIQVQASDIMATEPVTVASTSTLDQVATLMVERRIGSVIVSDANGERLGIFTASDALKALAEIVRAQEA